MRLHPPFSWFLLLGLSSCQESNVATRRSVVSKVLQKTDVDTSTDTDVPMQSGTQLCVIDPKANLSGGVAIGSCFPKNNTCPKGFVLKSVEMPNAGFGNIECKTYEAESVKNPERCVPDPNFESKRFGGPYGLCAPEPDGSCPKNFVKIKSVEPISDSGCSYRHDATL